MLQDGFQPWMLPINPINFLSLVEAAVVLVWHPTSPGSLEKGG
ncbi:hypothetical protein D918_01202 [Trichuris suis]|nr:hypothetical protein D918_01202 [Trichuris suis]